MQTANLQTVQFARHSGILVLLPLVFVRVEGEDGVTVMAVVTQAAQHHDLPVQHCHTVATAPDGHGGEDGPLVSLWVIHLCGWAALRLEGSPQDDAHSPKHVQFPVVGNHLVEAAGIVHFGLVLPAAGVSAGQQLASAGTCPVCVRAS